MSAIKLNRKTYDYDSLGGCQIQFTRVNLKFKLNMGNNLLVQSNLFVLVKELLIKK